MSRLKNKVAIVTGAAGEIGFATAKRFVAEGAKVMLTDLDEARLKQCVQELNTENAKYVAADVTKAEDVQKYVKATLDAWGRVDVFFNNAGIEGVVKPISDYPLDNFRKVMQVNVEGVFLGMKYVMPEMAKNGGSIIITSSVAGLQGTPNFVAYTTSKHAVIGIMRTAALEGAPQGIRVNSLHPGVIDSRMMNSIEKGFNPDDPNSVHAGFEQQVPLGRYGQEEEIANLALFLASDESSYTTGSIYVADGGMGA